ncbi:DUF1826 domain-containing protein [Tenacibaculum sp. 190524A02b]|uniref:DUF1826 domain-containing protein n=1 Tax=Tenacibaculum vairaonense TaxID=3137860 RepID=A0ABM9PIE0_9FLAO
MKPTTVIKNWITGTTPDILKKIHQKDINVAIYNRNIDSLQEEINNLLKQDISVIGSGSISNILNEVAKIITPNKFYLTYKDIKNSLILFSKVTGTNSFQLLIETINTNMCRKFHTDVNDLRMLCTYSGPGTLWLTEDNINRKALDTYKANESIVINENNIQQAQTGAVIILKGSVYKEKTKAAVHRSPTIEENGEKRILLRIDTTNFLKTC